MKESVYWNVDTENTAKQSITCLEYQPQESMLSYEIPCRQWKVVGADIFMVNNKIFLCIVGYYSMFPVMKKVGNG